MYTTDQTLVCADCNSNFTFTGSEQDFFAQKGFSAPRRCKPCRDAAKAAKGQSGGGYGGGSRGGDSYGARPAREMHDVICGGCGVQTQVPFKPSGDRPVYCRECFQR
ncbi:MAG: CxxC-x17-CxxC domain-containing protein [Candidatus Sericytochromatia bacterium]